MARRKVNKYVYRDGKTVLDTGSSSRLEPDINQTTPQLNPFWDQMPGRGGMGPHDNPNLAFFNDIRNARTTLTDPTQQFLVQQIQNAYNSGVPNPSVYPLRMTHEMEARIPGPTPTNIAEAEITLFNSFLPEALRFGQKMETTNVGMGDIISEMWMPTNPKTPGFHDLVMGWDETKGGVFQYMTNALKNSAQSGKRSFSTTGMHIDAQDIAEGLGGVVNGPDPDRQVAETDFLGVPASYELPEPKNWYQQLVENVGENTIPTPFFAPKGEGMFLQDANGRTVINPQLTRNPGFVGTPKNYMYNAQAGDPLHGYEQVSVTSEDLAGYAQTLDAYYGTPKEDRKIDFGTGPQVKGVNKFLRSLNEQVQGMETVSSDAQVIGAVAGVEDTFVRAQHPVTGFHDLTVDGLEDIRSMTLKDGNSLIAQRNPMVVNTDRDTRYGLAGREESTLAPDAARAIPASLWTQGGENTLPVVGESNRQILKDELYLQRIAKGGLSKPTSIDPGPDAIVPVKSVNEALWNTLQSFSSPTEKLMINAADEAMTLGRLLPHKIKRWKEAQNAQEERIEKASEWYGFDYERPQLAKQQTREWRQAQTAVEVQQRSREQLTTEIEQDPEFTDKEKRLYKESILNDRSFGGYHSQRVEDSMRIADQLSAREEAELAMLDENGMRIKQDELDGPAETFNNFVAEHQAQIEQLEARGLKFKPIGGGGGGQQPPNNNVRPTDLGPNEPNEQPNERLSDVGNGTELTPEHNALRADARETIARLQRDFPDWTPGRGTNAWFREFKAANPAFAEGHNQIMQEVRMSEHAGVPSVLQQTIEALENNGRGPASSPQPSSNGSGGGSNGSATPTPGNDFDPFENAGRRNDPSYEDQNWYNNGGTEEGIENGGPGYNAEQWEEARRQAADRANRTPASERLREDLGEEPNGDPLGTGRYVRPAPIFTSDGLRGRLMMGVNRGLKSRLGRSTEYERYNSTRQVWETHTMRAGNTHEQFGEFVPSNANEFAAGTSNAGAFFNSDTGAQTLTNEQVARGASIVEQAVNTAVNAGGLEGLNSRELAATLYKRVADAVRKIAYSQLEEAERHTDPAERVRLREEIQGGTSVAYDAMNRGVVNEIQDMTGVNAREIGNPATKIKSVEELNAFASRPGNEALARRVQELGGGEALMAGDERIVAAEGLDRSYQVGQPPNTGGRGRGGYGGDFFQSIYRTDLGRLMMAQYMGQMLWMKTGGDVLNDASMWGGNQYNYVGMENFGSGTPDGPAGFMARQEIAANRQGALAYEQYGFMKELGYAYGGNSLMGRWGNDVKMGVGIGAVAGIGAYSAAGMGMISGFGGMAAAGLGMSVGAGVAAAVAVPAMIGSAYNVATDQDSYSGWSPKNMLAAWYGMPTLNDEMRMKEQGYQKNELGLEGMWLQTKAYLGVGSAQEEYNQRAWGMSSQQFAEQTGTDPNKAAWMFAGRDEQSSDFRRMTGDIQEATKFKEDVVTKGLSAMQVAFGGLDTGQKELAAKYVFKQAADQGVSAESILSSSGSIAGMRGVLQGTEEFMGLTLNYAAMSPVEQQKYAAQAGREYQKYAQWVPYLEGGNAEGYSLFNQLGGTNAAQTQVIQSVLSQAQMSGASVTPQLAQQLATTANGIAPYRALDISQMSTQFHQMGTGSYAANFESLAGAAQAGQFGFSLSDVGNLASGTIGKSAGNTTDTMALLKGVASGNAYALSDYGRLADIGVLQSMDVNGLQSGLKDMSGFLAYARQSLGNDNLTGAQTLSGLGLTFGATNGSALLNGGIWGYQQSYTNQMNAFQSQQLGMQFDQLAQSRQYMYSSWGLEDQQMGIQWQSQLSNFAYQNTTMDLQRQFRLEDAADQRTRMDMQQDNTRWTQSFDYQTNLMRRDWAKEDYQFNTQMRSLSFGWNMEDMDEQIRRSSGYERAQLIKQRDRANLSNNLQSGQAEEQFERQEKLWEREDERYQKSLEFNEQMMQMDKDRFERNQEQAEQMYQLQKAHLAEEQETAEKLHDLRLQMEELSRDRQEQQLAQQEQSLQIQQQIQRVTNEYQNNMTKISHTQTEWEATLRKITSYQPAFSRLLTDFLVFLEDAQKVQVPTVGSGGNTYR